MNESPFNLLKPFTIYDYIVGFISGVILLSYGHWQLVLSGTLLGYAGYWVLSFLPQVPALLGNTFPNKISSASFSVFMLLLLRTAIIISWSYLVLSVLIRISSPPSIPFLLFSFFIITTPLNHVVLKWCSPQNYNASYEQLLFDFMLAAVIFFGLLIELDMLSLVLITGALVILIRIPLIIIGLFERNAGTDKLK